MATYADWEESVPVELKQDSLWRIRAYRLALFIGDIGWNDVARLAEDRRTRSLADQLYRALGSISANLAEGYSRGSGRDRARFLEYALGSAREAREWYYKGRHILGEDVIAHRIGQLTQIIKLLLTMLPDQRQTHLREHREPYDSDPEMNSP